MIIRRVVRMLVFQNVRVYWFLGGDAAGFYDTWGEQPQWPPLTEIKNFKNHNYLLNFILFVSK
jgi:hypothetical protein